MLKRWCTKGQEGECLLHKKKRAEFIDRWAHIGCQGTKMSEKSNSICYLKISQFQQESHLWHLGEWASFSPSLPCLFVNLSLIDSLIKHTLTAPTAYTASYFHFLQFSIQLNTSFVIRGNSLHVCYWGAKRIAGFISCKSANRRCYVWFDLRSPLVFCGQLKIDLQ